MGIAIDETVREADINDIFGIFKIDSTAEQVNILYLPLSLTIKLCFSIIGGSETRCSFLQFGAIRVEAH